MWEYKTSVEWKGEKSADVRCEKKPDLPFTAPPEFGGRDDCWSPEDLLVAAVESCLHLTARYWVGTMKIDMKGYRSQGVGRMERTANGLRFQGIDVRIQVDVGSDEDATKMQEAIEKTEQYCPVSQAVSCPIRIELETSVVG